MPTLVIRQAAHADIDSLIELAANTFRETYRSTDDPAEIEDYVAEAFTRTVFAGILADPRSTLLVGLKGDRLVAYAHTNQSTPPACVTGPSPIELARLYLRQDVIGKGYGRELMQAIIRSARAGNFSTIWLVVYSRNEHARRFYRRWGFVDVGTKDFIFGGRAYPDPVMILTTPKPAE